MKKINIAIDISPLNDGNSVRGVGYYTRHLLDALKKLVTTNPKYQHINIVLKDSAKLQNFDLIHYPFFDPFKLTLPSKSRQPVVVTIHDLIPRQFEKHFPVGIKGEIKWWIQKQRIKNVDHIITVSKYSKKIIHDLLSIPSQRISYAYEAADKHFEKISKNIIGKIKHKYKLPDKFVLFVGDVNWNKNLPTLVNACQELKYPLVIVGSAAVRLNVPNHPWTQDLLWLQKTYQNQDPKNTFLHFTGFVPDDELPYIYSLATIYCQPSFAEGFGLPVIQAMKSHCPVVYANRTSLKEIVNKYGLPFNPDSKDSLKKSLSVLWKNSKKRQSLAKSAFQYASGFTWEKTADETLKIYLKTLKP